MTTRSSATAIVVLVSAVFLLGVPAWLPGGWKAAANAAEPPPPRAPRSSRSYPPLPPTPPSMDFVARVVRDRFPDVDADSVQAFINDQFPEEMLRCRELAGVEPDEAVAALTQIFHDAIGLLDMRRDRPDLYEKSMAEIRLERRSRRLAALAGKAEGGEKDSYATELKAVLEEMFELRQDLMKAELEDMERDLDRLRALIRKRQENRAAIIERRLGDLTGEHADLGW